MGQNGQGIMSGRTLKWEEISRWKTETGNVERFVWRCKHYIGNVLTKDYLDGPLNVTCPVIHILYDQFTRNNLLIRLENNIMRPLHKIVFTRKWKARR